MSLRRAVPLLALLLLFGGGCDRGGLRVGGPLPQDAYVWQREWSEAVREAVGQPGTNFGRLVLLAGEVTWRDGAPQLTPVAIPYAELPPSRRGRVGLALRIGTYSGPFNDQDFTTRSLVLIARRLLHEATDQGVTPVEFELDFDCPDRRLAGYQLWAKAIRTAVAPVPLAITALPSWLDQHDFAPLVQDTDGFVLQVHSLSRPRNIGQRVQLCDPRAAERAVERAARIGRPFRVALPTYGYRVAFSTNGTYLGASAEGPLPAWPAGTRFGELTADPDTLAPLVARWSTNRPSALQGLIWYRLPVETDRLNWRWPTLAAVMEGRVPHPHLVIRDATVSGTDPRLREFELLNDGDRDHFGPARVQFRWDQGEAVAMDAVAGFAGEMTAGRSMLFTNASCRLRAGDRHLIGWVRLSTNAATSLELLP